MTTSKRELKEMVVEQLKITPRRGTNQRQSCCNR